MPDRSTFTFAIPLMARSVAGDWPLVQALCGLTVTSALAQTDPDVAVVIAGHDRPAGLPDDPRIRFLAADWPAEAISVDNRDKGRKATALIRQAYREGGGLVMLLDADDWVDRRLVETARRAIAPDDLGGVVDRGHAVDLKHLVAAPLPHPAVFDGGFHEVCGSSVVLHIRPEADDPIRRNPFVHLHEHHRVLETTAAIGGRLARLPVDGAYLVNTSENHSEGHGPYADWRRAFNDAVAGVGEPADQDFLARFGLTEDVVRTVSAIATRRR